MSGLVVRLNAHRPEALADFFVQALGFERLAPAGGVSPLTLGASRLEIVGCKGKPYPASVPGWSPLFQHFAMTTTDMMGAVARLERMPGWTPISRGGPQRLPANTGGVTAFKFRDPEGHPLELIAFPDEAEDTLPRIDHSAISVADTAASVAFYEALGLVVGGRSLNQGLEQERLDGLDGVQVEVTALQFPAGGAHVELLCYRGGYTRTNGPAAPDDVVATRLLWSVPLADRRRFVEAHVSQDNRLRGAQLLRDPDGHLLQLVNEETPHPAPAPTLPFRSS